jgi:hypothetical protein
VPQPPEQLITRTPATPRLARPAVPRAVFEPVIPQRLSDTATARAKSSAASAPFLLSPDARFLLARPKRSAIEPEPPVSLVPRVLTAAEKDSLARLLALEFAEAAARRVPTQSEKDERWRENSRPGTIPGRTAGEQGQVATRGSGGGFSAPFFSAGPSREQRKRDSTAAAEGLATLARLQERARRRRDSIRIADSIK